MYLLGLYIIRIIRIIRVIRIISVIIVIIMSRSKAKELIGLMGINNEDMREWCIGRYITRAETVHHLIEGISRMILIVDVRDTKIIEGGRYLDPFNCQTVNGIPKYFMIT
jgi:hypothetical protein